MLIASVLHYFMGWLLSLTSVFIVLLVLVQRGRGGGLAGALGGMGGQSAFGTKAGDNFTRITMIAATVWILLCGIALKSLSSRTTNAFEGSGANARPAVGSVAPAESAEAEESGGETSPSGSDGDPASDSAVPAE